MSEWIRVQFKSGEIKEVQKGTTLQNLANEMQKDCRYPIMLAKTDYRFRELRSTIDKEIVDLEWIHLEHKDGMRVYQRSATFLLIAAAKRLLSQCHILVNHHITGGFFCEFSDQRCCTPENIEAIEQMMHQMVKEALPIEKETVSVDEALELFNGEDMPDKVKLFKYRRTSTVNIYLLDTSDALSLFERQPGIHIDNVSNSNISESGTIISK